MSRKGKQPIPSKPAPCIQSWRFADCPSENLRSLCATGGDEEWITVIPAELAHHVDFLNGVAGNQTILIGGLGSIYGRLVKGYDGNIVVAWSH